MPPGDGAIVAIPEVVAFIIDTNGAARPERPPRRRRVPSDERLLPGTPCCNDDPPAV
jgi:hypothetical protein